MKRKKSEKASFTVEISLLMSILLPILMCLIYTGFYMHDRAFLEGAALEAACTASLYAGEEIQEEYTENREKASKSFVQWKISDTWNGSKASWKNQSANGSYGGS